MLTSSFIIAGAVAVLVILTLVGLMSRYRRCASDEILVVFGKAGKKTYRNPETGKEETLILPAMDMLGNLPIADTVKKVLGKDTPKVGE